MRVCRMCAGPMPEVVRDDALYCSTSCKLKAQRKRKKERERNASEEGPRIFEPVTPFRNAEQLSFTFVDAPTSAAATSSPAAPKSKPRSWFGELVEWVSGSDATDPSEKRDNSPRRQRSKATGLDIV